MNRVETAELLTIASGFDNRKVDALTTAAWMELLGGYSLAACRQAVLDHYRDPETRHLYLTAARVLDRVERSARAASGDVAADVRSAKARGLIDRGWPRREPLPADVAARLAEARRRDLDEPKQVEA